MKRKRKKIGNPKKVGYLKERTRQKNENEK